MTTTLIITLIGLFLCGALAVLVCVGGYKDKEEEEDETKEQTIQPTHKTE